MKDKGLFFWNISIICVGVAVYFYSQAQTIKASRFLPRVRVNNTTFAKVTRVYDGDTIGIDTGQKVRYIGMNTTEVYPTVECFGLEAEAENRKLVLGKTVKLVKDVSEEDKYGRLLRFVYTGEDPSTDSGQTSLFINDYLVKFGFAKVMTVPPDEEYKNQFTESEKYAKENKLGLWGKCF